MHSAPPSGGGSLSLNLQWLIDRCARQFVEQGTWPNERELLREGAKAGFELDDFFYQPTSRDFLWRRDHDGVIVSVAGLAHATIAAPLLADLLRFVRLCVLIYFGEGDDAPKVTADLLRSSLGMDEITIDRLFKLFSSTEYFLTAGGSSQSPTQWEYFISDLIRKFKSATNLADYFGARSQIVEPLPLPAPVLAPEFDITSIGVSFATPADVLFPNLASGVVDNKPSASINEENDLVVFVTWAHETDEWQASVLTFTNLLRAEGFDAYVDLYYKNRPTDWQLFGTRWIEKADVVLIVTSRAYARRWASEGPTGTGAGVAREAITLRQLFTEDQEKFLHKARVVLLSGVEVKDIPRDISHLSWIRVEELTSDGIDAVCRHLTGEDEYPMPEIGPRKERGPRVVTADPSSTESDQDLTPEDENGSEVTIGEADITHERPDGLLELRVPLNGNITPAWEQCFQNVSTSTSGSLSLVMSSPRIIGRFVFWNIEARDVEGAMTHIQRRVEDANTRYRGCLARQAELTVRAQAESEERAGRLKAARDRLKSSDT